MYVSIIGAGYWGPNLIRTFEEIPNVTVKYVVDKLSGRRKLIEKSFPTIETLENSKKIFKDSQINIIIIATPVETHYELAKKSLIAGKHIFVEKPFTKKSKEAKELIKISEEKSLKIGVGHLFTFHPAIEYINQFINSKNNFIPYYLNFNRANLRPPNSKLNVIWDLAVHDIAVSNYLFNEFPIDVDAIGFDYSRQGLVDMAFIKLIYTKNKVANIHVGWHTSNKIRKFEMFGLNWSIFFDDMLENKLQIFDKGIDNRVNANNDNKELFKYGTGEIIVPKIKQVQPLFNECMSFINSIINDKIYKNNGLQGYWVIKICEFIDKSIQKKLT